LSPEGATENVVNKKLSPLQGSLASCQNLRQAEALPGAIRCWLFAPEASFATVPHARGAPKRMKTGFADAHFGAGMV